MSSSVIEGDIQSGITSRERISKRAYFLWQARQDGRRRADWWEAGSRFMTENNGRYPNHSEHEQMAEKLHAEQREARALEDWYDACDFVEHARGKLVAWSSERSRLSCLDALS